MQHMRSLSFMLSLWIWTLIIGLTMPILLFVGEKTAWKIARTWISVVLWLLRVLCGVRSEIRGRDHIPKGPVIFASKHQSAWETLMFPLFAERPAFVLKRSLLLIPFFGQYLKLLGMIAINRDNVRQALRQLMQQAEAVTAHGRTMVIFPEGTRMPPGAKRKYRRGIVAMYEKLNIPVVPVGINSGLFWGKNSFLKYPGTAILEFGAPLQPGMEEAAFLTELEMRIESITEKLIREAVEKDATVASRVSRNQEMAIEQEDVTA